MWFSIGLTVLAGYMLGNLNGAVSISNLLVRAAPCWWFV